MIVATAGHVDHGKTTLVTALTGVDTDRLPEEKARGLSIDLGFAYLPLDHGMVLGFVDVPGHEKFIRNMVAGIGGIDLGLLVVAADDGVMPQTREHAAILNLMGVEHCIAVMTKIDRVDKARCEDVDREIQMLLDSTGLNSDKIFLVSAPNGIGINDLRNALYARAEKIESRETEGYFRLAVDRCFTLPGIGIVATGMACSGEVKVGDSLVVSPNGLRVRVRGIHAQNCAAEFAVAGQRAALNIAGRGVGEDTVTRGCWLQTAELHQPSDRMDAEIKVLASEARGLKHWTPVHVHSGAAHTTARVALLQSAPIEPGNSGLVQLVFDKPQCAVFGDRFVVRDQSALRTVAGGYIIDSYSPKRGRKHAQRLTWLRAMQQTDHGLALKEVAGEGFAGVNHESFCRIRNLQDKSVVERAQIHGLVSVGNGPERRWYSPASLTKLRKMLLSAVKAWHQKNPEERGANVHQLRMSLTEPIAKPVIDTVIADLVETKHLVQHGPLIQDPDHQVTLDPQEDRRWQQVAELLVNTEGSPMSLHQAAGQLNVTPKALDVLARKACKAGLAYRISRNRYVPAAQLQRIAHQLIDLRDSTPQGGFTVAQFRDHSGLGRNFAIDLLEYFDRLGLTERADNVRWLRRQPTELFG